MIEGEISRGHETLLLVEDDDSVRHFLKQALEIQGYRVLEAGRGREALRILRDGKDPVQFVLTDMMMPEMGGVGLSMALREHWPDLPVLYMSGHPEDPFVHARLRERGGCFIQKPFSPFELARRVRAILDGTLT